MFNVRHLKTNGGNAATNQVVMSGLPAGIHVKDIDGDDITLEEGELFVSYGSKIAYREYGGLTLLDDTYWNWSNTTGRYRNEFLGEGIACTREKIKSGDYILAHLATMNTTITQKITLGATPIPELRIF